MKAIIHSEHHPIDQALEMIVSTFGNAECKTVNDDQSLYEEVKEGEADIFVMFGYSSRDEGLALAARRITEKPIMYIGMKRECPNELKQNKIDYFYAFELSGFKCVKVIYFILL